MTETSRQADWPVVVAGLSGATAAGLLVFGSFETIPSTIATPLAGVALIVWIFAAIVCFRQKRLKFALLGLLPLLLPLGLCVLVLIWCTVGCY